jgi:adenylosuccinate synthase
MRVSIVVGTQFGDEGKGRVIDALTLENDIVVRSCGGANAGHTMVVNGKKIVTHLLPSGIVHPNKRCFMGAGMVIDPAALLKEIDTCRDNNIFITPLNLGISRSAHVIFPILREVERIREEYGTAIGTTRKGIGPAYEAKVARCGIQMWLLSKPVELRRSLSRIIGHFGIGQEITSLAFVRMVEEFASYGELLSPFMCDVSKEISDCEYSNILVEGAQGALLDIDYGTYPFVTSSSTTAAGALCGAGIGPNEVYNVWGVTKAYLTRVGNGPFPTMMSSSNGDDASLEETIRVKGGEFGSTTGRPRKCGWLDIPALKMATRINGLTDIALTKLDILRNVSPLRMCVGYTINGKYTEEFPYSVEDLYAAIPKYEDFEGFTEDLRDEKYKEGLLPTNVISFLHAIENKINVPISMVSSGPSHEDILKWPLE